MVFSDECERQQGPDSSYLCEAGANREGVSGFEAGDAWGRIHGEGSKGGILG